MSPKAAAVEDPPGIKDNSGHENTQEVCVFLREQALRPYTGRASFLEILIKNKNTQPWRPRSPRLRMSFSNQE